MRNHVGVQTDPVERTIGSRKEGNRQRILVPTGRVVSLPETSSPLVELAKASTPRVASLSERPKPTTISSPTAATSSNPQESFEYSSSQSYTTISAALSTSSDVPQTPSPPSSPDSVMIIADTDARVSHGFMRSGKDVSKKQQNYYKPDSRREDGTFLTRFDSSIY